MNYKNPTKAKEIDALLGYIENGKAEGKTLGELFAEYAELHKKAKGSVRNRYYDLLKTGERDDAFRNRFLCGRTLKAEKREAFTEEDEKELLLGVFRQKTKGVSVRKALLSLSGGDDKKMLRYQNKFRNLLVKNRPLVEEAVRQVKAERGECFDPYEKSARRDFLHYKLEKEIDGLYDRLSGMLRQKNKELTAEVARLKKENAALTALFCRIGATGGGTFAPAGNSFLEGNSSAVKTALSAMENGNLAGVPVGRKAAGNEAPGTENEETGRDFRHVPHKNGNGGAGGCGAQDAEALLLPSEPERTANASVSIQNVENAAVLAENGAMLSALAETVTSASVPAKNAAEVCEKETELSASAASSAIAIALQGTAERPAVRPL